MSTPPCTNPSTPVSRCALVSTFNFEIGLQPATPLPDTQFNHPSQHDYTPTIVSQSPGTPVMFRPAHSPSSSYGSEGSWTSNPSPFTTPNLSPLIQPLPLVSSGNTPAPRRRRSSASTQGSRKAKAKSHGKKQPPGHIPRPPNAFILFRSDFVRRQALSKNVECDHRKISKIVGRIWGNMSESEKAIWKGRAAEENRRHKLAHPHYRYSPVGRKDANGDLLSGSSAPRAKRRRNVTAVKASEDRRCEVIADLLIAGQDDEKVIREAIQDMESQTSPPVNHQTIKTEDEEEDSSDADFVAPKPRPRATRKITADSVMLPAQTSSAAASFNTRRRSLSTSALSPPAIPISRRARAHIRADSDLLFAPRPSKGRMTNNSLSAESIFNNVLPSTSESIQTHARRVHQREALIVPSPVVFTSNFSFPAPSTAYSPASAVSTPATTFASLQNSPVATPAPLLSMSPAPGAIATAQPDFSWESEVKNGAQCFTSGLDYFAPPVPSYVTSDSIFHDASGMEYGHLVDPLSAACSYEDTTTPFSLATTDDLKWGQNDSDEMEQYINFDLPPQPSWPASSTDGTEWAAYKRGLEATKAE